MNRLVLKWGTVKAWDLETDDARAAFQKWASYGMCMSAVRHRDTPEQRQALLAVIDCMDEITLDLEGRTVSRDEAKEYVRTYGRTSVDTDSET